MKLFQNSNIKLSENKYWLVFQNYGTSIALVQELWSNAVTLSLDLLTAAPKQPYIYNSSIRHQTNICTHIQGRKQITMDVHVRSADHTGWRSS